jgi:hypothetical protein
MNPARWPTHWWLEPHYEYVTATFHGELPADRRADIEGQGFEQLGRTDPDADGLVVYSFRRLRRWPADWSPEPYFEFRSESSQGELDPDRRTQLRRADWREIDRTEPDADGRIVYTFQRIRHHPVGD